MEDLTTRAQLVDSQEVEARGVTATIARGEIEGALAAEDGPADLILDVSRFGDGQGEESKRVAVEWERADLERLLAQAQGDMVTLAFDRSSLVQALEAPDVEGHGLREKALVLTVAAATAAGAAGAAQAVPDIGGAGGSASGPAAYAIESARSAEAAAPEGAAMYGAIEAARAAEAAPTEGAAPVGGSIEAARAVEAAPTEGAAPVGGSIEAARAAEATPTEGAAPIGGSIEAAAGGPREYGMPQPTAADYQQGREYGMPQPTAADYVQAGDYGLPTAMPADYEVGSDPGSGVSFEAPSPGEAAALAGVAALAITGAAFAARSRRKITPST